MLTAHKAGIKDQYLATLKVLYPSYTEGSRPLALAEMAADNALAGKVRLTGEAWERALATYGLPKTVTLKALAALPDTI